MREGMQIESAEIRLEDKVRLLEALSQTGLKYIVAGSFVSPRWTPQMAEVDALLDKFTPVPGVNYSALALNSRGAERAQVHTPPLSPGDGLPRTFVHVCDVFVRRNANRSQADEISSWPDTVQRAVAEGKIEAGIGINAAWGSNWLGEFSLSERMDLLEKQHRLWTAAGIRVAEVVIGDPMGWNMPDAVEEQLLAIRSTWPEITRFHLHLHNQRGTAPISIYAALRTLTEECELILDTTVGGIGGCPYCGNGRATGMMPTEDLVDLLHELGIETGVDLDALIEVVILTEEIIGHPTDTHVARTGPRPRGERLYAMDMPFVETFEQAQHFRVGPSAYAGAPSPWKSVITSPSRDRLGLQQDKAGAS
ncbi:citramalate synthase [Pseudarthrobacter sulfonivorans]|uniref:Citramalate synthase n=2 Tax=Pseudarthrobacter sulfonivorans TaxID=121292 RepID=A0A0U3PMU4_9MICC|nr:citramalate synthase [Pseudarthrobacter sulfonivorans]